MINQYEYNLQFIPKTSLELKEKHKYTIDYNRNIVTVKDFIDLIEYIKFKKDYKFKITDYSVLIIKNGLDKFINVINLQ